MDGGKGMDIRPEAGGPVLERLRDLSAADIAAFRKLTGSYYERFNMRIEGEKDSDLADLRKAYIESNGALFVIRDQGEIVGSVAIVGAEGGKARFKRLQVAQTHRGRGTETLLLKRALEYAKSHGYTGVLVDAHEKDDDMRESLRELDFHAASREGSAGEPQQGELFSFERSVD